MKIDEHRNKYFEDLEFTVTKDEKGRKHYRTKYTGIWYCWGGYQFSKKKYVLIYAALEIIGIVCMITAGISRSRFNAVKALGGCVMLSVVAQLLEVRGVTGFIFSHEYMYEIDYKSIHARIQYGTLIKVALLSVGLIIGLIASVAGGYADIAGIRDFILYALSATSSAALYRLQTKMGYRAYRNNDGEIGSAY